MFELKKVKFLDVLDIDYLKIEENKINLIVGPSGSGKSTLLKLLNKIISPSSGDIYYKGKNLKDIDSLTLRREVPMLGQDIIRYEGNVRDNLLIGLRFQERRPVSDEKLKKALANVDLDIDLATDIKSLSGGEMQRVAISRLALLDREVYLMDEPSSALDKETEDLVIKTFIKNLQGKTLVYVTHSEELAKKYADKVIKIIGGRLSE